jgi:hypothetical protein
LRSVALDAAYERTQGVAADYPDWPAIDDEQNAARAPAYAEESGSDQITSRECDSLAVAIAEPDWTIGSGPCPRKAILGHGLPSEPNVTMR